MGEQAATGAKAQFTTFAWQGIVLTLPAEWDLVRIQGDYDSGYVALGDGENVRLQMKWATPGGQPEPSRTVEKYLRQLRKDAQKQHRQISIQRELKLASLAGKQIECYEWVGEVRGTALVSRCEECERVIHLGVIGKPDEPQRKLARTIFASLKDHPEGELLPWKFYDVEFCSPTSMRLRRKELNTGCIRMLFRGKGSELDVLRVSLASVLLGRFSLQEWFQDFYGKGLRGWSKRFHPTELGGHRALKVDGGRWLIANPWRLLGRAKRIRALCWHCPQSNRLFIVRHSGRLRERDAFDRTLRTVKCCEKNGGGIAQAANGSV